MEVVCFVGVVFRSSKEKIIYITKLHKINDFSKYYFNYIDLKNIMELVKKVSKAFSIFFQRNFEKFLFNKINSSTQGNCFFASKYS